MLLLQRKVWMSPDAEAAADAGRAVLGCIGDTVSQNQSLCFRILPLHQIPGSVKMDEKAAIYSFEYMQQSLIRNEVHGPVTELIQNVRSGIGDFNCIFTGSREYLTPGKSSSPDFIFSYDKNFYLRNHAIETIRKLTSFAVSNIEKEKISVDTIDLICLQHAMLPPLKGWAGMEHTQVFPFVVPTKYKNNIQEYSSTFNDDSSFSSEYLLADTHIVSIIKKHGSPDRVEKYRNNIMNVVLKLVSSSAPGHYHFNPFFIPLNLLLQCNGIYIVDSKGVHWPLLLWEPIYQKVKSELERFDIIWYIDGEKIWAFEPKDIPRYIILSHAAKLGYTASEADYDCYKAYYQNLTGNNIVQRKN